MRRIATGIYVETTYRRVNVAAIETDEGFILIDTPPYPEDAQDWRRQLSEIADLPVLFIVNTDHHRDRILGNDRFGGRIVAQRAAADRILALEPEFISLAAEELADDEEEFLELASLKLAPPQVSYGETMMLNKGGREVTLTHVPGATAGSTWIELLDERVLFVGDHVVTTTHPFMADAVSKAWLDALTWLRRGRFDGYKIVPGRGAVTKPEPSHAVPDYVRSARRRVQGLFRSGRPRADTATLVDGLISEFPIRNGDREEIGRRIRAGLEHIYDEIKAGDG
jgi:glyoxylase-like metal-dependent hydrolase (beta-lactamase superfamily II)